MHLLEEHASILISAQAGIMEEMLEDTLEGLDEDEELEEEAEAEVDRVLYEITDGKLGVAGAGKELPVRCICPIQGIYRLRLADTHRRARGNHRSRDGPHASSAQQPTERLAYLLYPGLYFPAVIYGINCYLRWKSN
jgi:hypothetical protein